MPRRSDPRLPLTGALAAAALLWFTATGPAHAQASPPVLPDDDAPDAVLDRAFELQAAGGAQAAAQVLLRLAEQGHVVAMERLALMHWYGKALYPHADWSRETGARWFARAAAAGSELGRHMQRFAPGPGTTVATRPH